MGFFATSRGITNETYYAFQKAARLLGSNHVDLCARLCHAASVAGLKDTLGIAAPTCSLKDLIGTDLVVIMGSHLANNQPVTDQVPVLREAAGHTHRGGEPDARAGARALLGAERFPAARCSARG